MDEKQKDYLIFLISLILLILLIIIFLNLDHGQLDFSTKVNILVKSILPDLIASLIVFVLIYQFLKKQGIISDETSFHKRIYGFVDESKEQAQEIKDFLLTDQKLRSNGIEDIYPDRSEFIKELKNDLTSLEVSAKPGSIKLLGISLRGFFNSARNESLEMRHIIETLVVNKKLKIQALIMDQNSKQAEIRRESDKEGWDPGQNYFNIDINNTIRFFQTKKTINSNLSLKLYNEIAPFCFMVIFKDYVAVEQYHTGAQGGKIPVIKYNIDSVAGERFLDHFKFVWNHDTTIQLENLAE